MDSDYDFSISKLTHIIRSTLMRESSRKQHRERKEKAAKATAALKSGGATAAHKENQSNTTGTAITAPTNTTEDPILAAGQAAERQRLQLEKDVDDCLSRIHVVQVDDGTTGWVPVLEVLRHELAKRQSTITTTQAPNQAASESPEAKRPQAAPTLLLWDGFLADVGNETSSREILQQMSRLLEQESSNVWWVVSATATSHVESTTTLASAASNSVTANINTKGSRVGNQVAEWMKQQWQRKQQAGDGGVKVGVSGAAGAALKAARSHLQQQATLRDIPRECCRVRLDKASGSAGILS
ncbi:MAG: hypothetical protein SGARI_004980 [Bacillariaceae sp.]